MTFSFYKRRQKDWLLYPQMIKAIKNCCRLYSSCPFSDEVIKFEELYINLANLRKNDIKSCIDDDDVDVVLYFKKLKFLILQLSIE